MGYTSKGKFIPKITKNQMDIFGLEDEIKTIPSRIKWGSENMKNANKIRF